MLRTSENCGLGSADFGFSGAIRRRVVCIFGRGVPWSRRFDAFGLQPRGQEGKQDVASKSGLAGAADAGEANEIAQGYLDREIVEIVERRVGEIQDR